MHWVGLYGLEGHAKYALLLSTLPSYNTTFFFLLGSQTTYWGSDILVHDGNIEGLQVEFKSYYLPNGHMEFQYTGTFNDEMTTISGSFTAIYGATSGGTFSVDKD